MYIILATLIFGVLIAVHEFGHFIFAKLFHIRVNEFSIGMGPAIWKKEKGETLYSFRILPIGGYCAMEGEDDDSADPRAFGKAAGWKKVIVLVAGAAMNFLTGLLIVLVLYAPAKGFYVETYAGPLEGYGTEDCGLQEGDRFISVDGHRVLTYGNAQFYLNRAGNTVDFVVERDGQEVRLDNVSLPRQQRVDENGQTTNYRGISVGREAIPATLVTKLSYSWNYTIDFVRLVWVSLGDLLSGAVGVRDLSGPVGIVDTMNQVGSQSASLRAGIENLMWLGALIAVNLAVMNLLPLPALDGGRVFFLLLNGVLTLLFRKKIPAKYEGYVHLAGLAALMTLMLMVTFSDIGKIFAR